MCIRVVTFEPGRETRRKFRTRSVISGSEKQINFIWRLERTFLVNRNRKLRVSNN